MNFLFGQTCTKQLILVTLSALPNHHLASEHVLKGFRGAARICWLKWKCFEMRSCCMLWWKRVNNQGRCLLSRTSFSTHSIVISCQSGRPHTPPSCYWSVSALSRQDGLRFLSSHHLLEVGGCLCVLYLNLERRNSLKFFLEFCSKSSTNN